MRRKTTTKRKTAPKKKTTTRRRRRVSGIGSIDAGGMAMKVLGVGAGAIAAREASTLVLKMAPSTSQLMIGAGQVVVGLFLPKLIKSKFGQDMGDGMMAFGVQVMAVNAGLITGIGSVPTMSYRVNGTSRLNPINGTDRLRVVSGVRGVGAVNTPARRKVNFSTTV